MVFPLSLFMWLYPARNEIRVPVITLEFVSHLVVEHLQVMRSANHANKAKSSFYQF